MYPAVHLIASSYELIIIFFLVFTASAIPAWAFSSYWISAITAPRYYATTENQTLPIQVWGVWMAPLFWWTRFYFAIFVAGASAMVMLRKQWVEHERLTFPLAQVPLILVEEADGRRLLPPITRHRLFWYVFGATAFILPWNIISYFNIIPLKWINNREAMTGMEFGFLGFGGLVNNLLIAAHHRFPW